jgi:hypothetical protein
VTLRVAMSGASGTGKTTLARFIAEAYGLPVNPVGARSIARDMGFANPYDVDVAGKRAEFQRRLLTEKLEWERLHADVGFVADRTVLDNLTYTILHDVYSLDGKALDDVHVGLARYTHVFFCPVDSHFKLDGDQARIASPTYHRVFEEVLYGLLEGHQVDVHLLNTPDLEERKAYIRGVLSPVDEQSTEPTTGVREVSDVKEGA